MPGSVVLELTGDAVTVDRDPTLSIARDVDTQGIHTGASTVPAMDLDDFIAPSACTLAVVIKTMKRITDRHRFLPGGRGIEIRFVRQVYAGHRLSARLLHVGRHKKKAAANAARIKKGVPGSLIQDPTRSSPTFGGRAACPTIVRSRDFA